MKRRNRVLGVGFGVLLLVVGCGRADRELVGYSSDPPADVSQVALPDLSDGGRPFSMRAAPGHVLVVYFGCTNCPDFCPTTMSDLRIARRKLDHPERVDVAMVTVDPERDLPVLDDYVSSFFDDGHALGTLDADELVHAASERSPHGASSRIGTDTPIRPVSGATGRTATRHLRHRSARRRRRR